MDLVQVFELQWRVGLLLLLLWFEEAEEDFAEKS